VTHRPQQWFSPKNHGEGGSEHVQYRPQSQSEALLTGEREKDVPFSNHLRGNEPLDMPIERFLASLRFEQRGKLDQIGFQHDKK
jgi:hypothetical protein